MTVTPEQRTWARIAGCAILANYVLQGLGDSVTILARRGETFAETMRWAAEAQPQYRVALLEVAAAWIAIAILAFALYVVLEPVHRRLAQLALVLRLGASFVGASSVMLRMAEAGLYRVSATEGLFTVDQLRALVRVTVRSAGAGVEIAWIFLGAGSLIAFLLFWWSRYMPRALAGFGFIGSGLVVVMAAAMIVIPERVDELKIVGVPFFLAEAAMAFWLLIRGLNPRTAMTPGA